MQKITITKLFRNTKDKNGNNLVSKAGKPYEKVAIKTAEYGDKWINGFGNEQNAGWKVGDIVDVIIEQNGEWLNFKTPNKNTELLERIKSLELRVSVVEGKLSHKTQENEEPPVESYNEF